MRNGVGEGYNKDYGIIITEKSEPFIQAPDR